MPFLLPSQRCSITKRGAVSICSASHKTVLLSFGRYFLVTVHQSWHFKNFFTSSVTHISACNWSKIYLLILFAFSPVSHEVYVVSCVKTRIAAYVLQLMSFNKYVTRIHFWFWVAICVIYDYMFTSCKMLLFNCFWSLAVSILSAIFQVDLD